MNMDHPDKVFAFDSLFTTNHIQMLKILSCYLSPPLQGKLIVYIRFLELQYTLRLFTRNPYASMPFGQGNMRTELLQELLPFCDPREKRKVQDFQNLFQNMEQMQNMLQMLDLLKDISPELFHGTEGGQAPFPDLAGMFTGIDPQELSQMMDMIQEFYK
ncbi:MAG: hypothetical protein IJ747_06700 [Lachnospiraceae bacterium]|nr:hypothetical protein [Lachnospiraceae bacterium]